MAFRGVYTLLLAVIWTAFFSSTLGIQRFKARIRVNNESAEFHRFNLSGGHTIDNLMLVHDPNSVNTYAGGPQGLYMLTPVLKQVNVPIFESECETSSKDCEYQITLLKEGRNGNPLFMCGTTSEKTQCCDVNPEHLPVNCFTLKYPTEINQPSVQVGDSLYYTVSSETQNPSGLYRQTQERTTWPMSRHTVQKYVKILADQGNGPVDRKMFTFYTELNQHQDLDMPRWIPRVSQICMADRGGSKAVLQYRWTSMLTARLFCGNEEKHLSYTELLDVAVLEDVEWENTTIYALFTNAYDLRAVCIYKMSDIIGVFKSSEFKTSPENLPSHPGECVENSNALQSDVLKFMEKRPEMKQWIKPAREPLLFDHHHYTHLLVDRVKSSQSEHHNVLLMSLENGKVHKILEQDGYGEPFVIAEYEPFKTRTRISSMLLHNKTKKLYVSSDSEVVQIDLRSCSVYGKHCDSCVLARDPYCGWYFAMCSANHGSRKLIQDVAYGNFSVCGKGESRTYNKRDSFIGVPQDSNFFLKCPMESQHASYAWDHQGRRRECVSVKQDCVLLIDSMSEEDEGVYKCVASESGYDRTIVQRELQMNAASESRTSHVALACLLFLIHAI